MDVTVVDHPLAARQLTRLRDETTDRATFRLAMDDLAGMLVYEAGKAAVMAMTRQMAIEYGPDNIRVNAISAGPIRTLAAAGVGGRGQRRCRASAGPAAASGWRAGRRCRYRPSPAPAPRP